MSINTEETDQKLVRHMIQCVRSGVKQCAVRTVDTDVVISLITYRHLAENFDCVVFACLSSALSNRFYNNKITEEYSETKFRALPFFCALTGCDNWTIHSFCVLWTMYKFKWLTERMWDTEYSLHGNLRFIPPSGPGLKEHIKRAAYHAGWVNFQYIENVCLPSPPDSDWKFSNGLPTPLWHSSEVTVNVDFLRATCGCSSQKCI